MNRSQLISAFEAETGLGRAEADWFVRQFFDSLAMGLKRDGRVELRGFGVFKLYSRRQAGFQNPRDGRYYGGVALKTVRFYPSLSQEKGGF